jgi:hypothetical protein
MSSSSTPNSDEKKKEKKKKGFHLLFTLDHVDARDVARWAAEREAIKEKLDELNDKLSKILSDDARVARMGIPRRCYVVLHANGRLAWSVDVGAAMKAIFGDAYEDYMDIRDVKNAYVCSEYPKADHSLTIGPLPVDPE